MNKTFISGNQAEYPGVTVSKVTPFRSGVEFREAIDTVVSWFALDNIELACLYTDQPDKHGHRYLFMMIMCFHDTL